MEEYLAQLELVKRGILIKKRISKPLPGMENITEILRLSERFYERFSKSVLEIVKKNVAIHAKFKFENYMYQLDLFPNEVKKQKVIELIEKIAYDTASIFLDDETIISMIVDYYGYADYLKFDDGKLIILKNQHINEHIEDAALRKCALLLQNEYSEIIAENPSKPQNQKLTFQWQTNPDRELPNLYKLLLQHQLIAPETTLEQLTGIFTGQVMESITPIKWKAAKNLLAFFIESIYKDRKLYEINNPDKWLTAKHCFVGATNLGQAVDNYNNNKTGLPKNHQLIIDLIKAL